MLNGYCSSFGGSETWTERSTAQSSNALSWACNFFSSRNGLVSGGLGFLGNARDDGDVSPGNKYSFTQSSPGAGPDGPVVAGAAAGGRFTVTAVPGGRSVDGVSDFPSCTGAAGP